MGPMATLKDVAQHAEVSAMTVSHVVNGTKAVSPEVKRRVLASVAELKYQPNRSARALRTNRSATLGLIVPELTNPFFPELIELLEKEARHRGYATLLVSSNLDPKTERQGFELFLQHGVDGVIWCPHDNRFKPEGLPFPLIVVDRPLSGFDNVSANHFEGGKRQGQYATELGHQHIGVLKGPSSFDNARRRYEGLLAGLGGNVPTWQFEVSFSLSLELPAEVIEVFNSDQVSMIVAVNDVVAIAALRALYKLGKRVPEQVSLIGFDDTAWATLMFPALTTIRQPKPDLAARAVETLLKRIHNPERKLEQITQPVELIVRQSTAKWNAGNISPALFNAGTT